MLKNDCKEVKMNNMRYKKGIALGQAFGAVLALVLVAVLVIISIYLFTTLGSSFAGTSTGSQINESVTMRGPTVSAVANSSLCQFSNLAVSAVYNGTGGVLVPATNYTVGTNSIVNKTGSADYGSTTWLVNYNYKWGGPACTATEGMTTNFSNYPTLIGLVGTIIFLALVIGVLVASFAFGRSGGP